MALSSTNTAPLGNQLFTLSSGHTAAYTNNSLNQITSRDVPGWVSTLGEANSNATVTLCEGAGVGPRKMTY